MEKGGTDALDKSAWSDHFVQETQWVLVGIPGETVREEREGTVKANLVSIPLLETTPPLIDEQKADNQFYAKLNEKKVRHVDRVEGMSGGPIFALKMVDGILSYAVIGIQSAWYPSDRIIVACPFSTFGNALEMVVQEARQKLSQSRTASVC